MEGGRWSGSGLDQMERSGQEGSGEARSVVPDQFDVSLEDSDLLVEVELTTNLIIAASASEQRLTQEEIDRILGVERGSAV